MLYNIENRGNVSIYEYLYLCIKEDILSGKIAPGQKLPSKRELAKSHGISVITVENAYAQLMTEGYIHSQEKRGYFASDIGTIYSYRNDGKNRLINSQTDSAENPDDREWFVDFHSGHIFYDGFPFSTWAKVMRQTLLDEEQSFLKSPNHNGVAPLREAIAKHLGNYRGMDVNPGNIVVGAGTEYLYSLIVQLLGHSRMIAVEDPGHKKIGKIYESNGIKCLHIGVDSEGMIVDELEGNNVAAVHISPSHHFPTGCVMPVARRYQLIRWAKENNSYIIEDDYDSEFRFSGRPIPTIASLDENQVIYLNTFSKTLAPSIRIAYMILPDKLMEKFRQNFSFYSSTVSGFEQYTLANFIQRGYYERHINRMRNYYREYRNRILMAIKNSPIYDKVAIKEEHAGLHFILEIDREMDDEWFKEQLRQKNINLSAVAEYCYHYQEKYRHQFIINYSAVKEDDLKEALLIMNRILEQLKNKKGKIQKGIKEKQGENSNTKKTGNRAGKYSETKMNQYQGNKDIKINIPKNVEIILQILENRGFEAFAVGGCVRDTILGRVPGDWDITTSALPEQIKEIFHKTIDTGIEHGTVTVRIGGEGYEVTTYRIDGEYKDSRHPDSVEYTTNLIEDLKRRDFTINAMAYNPSVGLIDAFDGMGDLNAGIIACVGNAKERFGEDALRILRALRFSAQLGFDIRKSTIDAMKELAPTLMNISAERIHMELEKLILSEHPEKLIQAYVTGITKIVLPEFDEMMRCEQNTPYHMYNVGVHTIEVMKNVSANKVMRWASLLHDVGKPKAKTTTDGRDHFYGHAHIGSKMVPEILRRLKMDNKTIKAVVRLIDHHDDRPLHTKLGQTPEAVRRSVHMVGKDIYPQYLELVNADFFGKSDFAKEAGYEEYIYVYEQFKIIMEHNICTSVGELAVSGKDLIEIGCPLGEKIGEVLNELLEIVLKEPENNQKEILLKEAEKLFE